MPAKKNLLEDELQATWKYPEALRQASEEVAAAVELGWVAARTVFGKQARPQHAIELARLFMERAPFAPHETGPTEAVPLDQPPPPRPVRTGMSDAPPRAPKSRTIPPRI